MSNTVKIKQFYLFMQISKVYIWLNNFELVANLWSKKENKKGFARNNSAAKKSGEALYCSITCKILLSPNLRSLDEV